MLRRKFITLHYHIKEQQRSQIYELVIQFLEQQSKASSRKEIIKTKKWIHEGENRKQK